MTRRVEAMYDVARIQHDVPVERAHVEALKVSLQQQGQLSPVLLRTQDKAVIDGFHRLTALRELGVPTCVVSFVDCTDEQFRDARITSAAMHRGVSFARLTVWVREEFLQTKWAGKLEASSAFRVGGKQGEYLSMAAFEKHWGRGLTGGELYEIVAWVKAKAALWGLSPDQIANMLEIAERASPLLVPLVRPRRHNREEVLTRPMLAKIVKHIPNQLVQEAVAKKAMVERLDEKEAARLVMEAAETPTEKLGPLLTTRWLDVEQARRDERLRAQSAKTPEQQQAQADALRATMTISLIDEVAERVKVMPKPLPATLAAEFGRALANLYTAVELRSGQHTDALAKWYELNAQQATEIKNLQAENEVLRQQVTRLQRTIGLGQQKYIEQTSA